MISSTKKTPLDTVQLSTLNSKKKKGQDFLQFTVTNKSDSFIIRVIIYIYIYICIYVYIYTHTHFVVNYSQFVMSKLCQRSFEIICDLKTTHLEIQPYK